MAHRPLPFFLFALLVIFHLAGLPEGAAARGSKAVPEAQLRERARVAMDRAALLPPAVTLLLAGLALEEDEDGHSDVLHTVMSLARSSDDFVRHAAPLLADALDGLDAPRAPRPPGGSGWCNGGISECLLGEEAILAAMAGSSPEESSDARIVRSVTLQMGVPVANRSMPVCEWESNVFCQNGRVVSLILSNAVNASRLGQNAKVRVPDEIGNLTALTDLTIANSTIDTLPESMGRLIFLQQLSIDNNDFTSFPFNCSILSSLDSLTMSENRLTEIDDNILSCPSSLVSVDFSNNLLTEIPREFCRRFKQLTALSLSGNPISELPDNIGELEELLTIDLSSMPFTVFPSSLTTIVNLAGLAMFNTDIASVPDEICKLKALGTFDISSTRVSELPECMGQLDAISYLSLSKSLMASLPADMSAMTSLQIVNGNGCRFKEFPIGLASAPNVTVINLSENAISALPKSFCDTCFRKLVGLDLSNNNLQQFPEAATALPQLYELRLRENQISGIPLSIANLAMTLVTLDMANNHITNLPPTFSQLVWLSSIDLSMNGIAELDHDVFRNLSRVVSINFSTNLLRSIPELLAADPEQILFADNQIQVVPDEISRLQSLQVLDLSNNDLVLVPDLTHLHQLTALTLSGNPRLSGPLPKFSATHSLDTLRLSRTNFSGPVPDEYSRIKTVIDLSNNVHLEGALGAWTCSSSTTSLHLQNTSLSSDDIVTDCPSDAVGMSNLRTLDLRHNQLTDQDVAKLGAFHILPNLESLDLSFNPIGRIVSMTRAFSLSTKVGLSFLGLANTDLKWDAFVNADGNGIGSLSLACGLLLNARGTVDVSNNNLLLGTTVDGLRFQAAEIIANNVTQPWGQAQFREGISTVDPPFGEGSAAMFDNVRRVSADMTLFDGFLPSPDTTLSLRYLNVFDSRVTKRGFEGGWEIEGSVERTQYETFQCPTSVRPIRHGQSGYEAVVHPNFYRYEMCRCDGGYFGAVPLDGGACAVCFDNAQCLGNGTLTATAQWPVTAVNGSAIGLVDCPGSRGDESPCRLFTVTVSDYEVLSDIHCREGHVSDRFCTKCKPGFYRHSGLCFPCIRSFTWLPLAFYVCKILASVLVLAASRTVISGPLRILFVHLSLFTVMTDESVVDSDHSHFLSWLGAAGSGGLMPGLECVSHTLFSYDGKFLVTASIPGMLVVCSAAVLLIGLAISRKSSSAILGRVNLGRNFASAESARQRAAMVGLFLWLTYLLSFSRRLFSVLNCSSYGTADHESTTYVTNLMSLACSGETSWRWMSLVAWLYALPIVVFSVASQAYVTWKKRNDPHAERATKGALAFLFSAYKPKFFYWELLVTVRRLSIALVLALSDYRATSLPAAIFVILFASLLLHLRLHPYASLLSNRMESLSLSTLIIGFFVVTSLRNNSVALSGTAAALDWVVLGLNAAVALLFLCLVVVDRVRAQRFKEMVNGASLSEPLASAHKRDDSGFQ